MVCDALQTGPPLLSEVVAFHSLSVSLEEKYAIDKLLWRQQRAFMVCVVVIHHAPPSPPPPPPPPWEEALQSGLGSVCLLCVLNFRHLFCSPSWVCWRSLLLWQQMQEQKEMLLFEQKDARAFWLGGSCLFSLRSRAGFSSAGVPVYPSHG